MTRFLPERRLAAVLAADIVGYSRLIEADEADTLAAIKGVHLAVIEPLLAEYRGRIVKLIGDGIIAEFGSVVDAAACAVAVQQQVAIVQAERPPTRRIVFRVGVNLGDVVVEAEDLLGDGVNIAARLEQLCPPGGVLISGTTYDHLQGKLDCHFEFLGEQRLKNIARPVRVYRMAPGTPIPGLAGPMTADKPAVAVLPFENLSGDPAQTYFSDGITEDIVTELARFRELLVIARNSSFAFRGQPVDVREIGRVLGAGYVVEGSVRLAGAGVRITAQLIEAASGTHVWSERYNRQLEDIFAIQDDIARGIVATVARRVLEDSEAAARRRPPQDIRAYDLFLQGRRLSDVFTPAAQEQARRFFEQARDLDPTFARAYTGLAFNRLNHAIDVSLGVPREKDPDRIDALRLAVEALALDPNDPQVQSTLGYMCLTWREFDRAARHLDLARSFNPNDAMVQITWAWVQACIGNPGEGLEAAEFARRLNPLHPGWYGYYRSRILFLLGRYEEAAAILEEGTSPDPLQHPQDLGWWAAACGHLGRTEQAHQCAGWFIQSVRELWRGDPAAGAVEYVRWLVDVSNLQHSEDEMRLREGMRLAGLPT
jgi:adenylate cyclase